MAVVFALTTFVSTAVGGLVALRNRDRLHLVLGFTAGVLLGLVAFHLLPELFELASYRVFGVPAVMLSFAGGFLALHLLERALALHRAHEGEYGDHRHPYVGLASALALVTHSFMDGLGIGLAFQVNQTVGLTVALAVIAHDFADGLNTVGIMLAYRNSARRAILLLALDAVAPVLGALSTVLFELSERVLGLYLGFFTGFLLYLSTSDILPEAHARHPSGLTLACTVAGLVAMYAMVALA